MDKASYTELATKDIDAVVQLILEKDRQIRVLEQGLINANKARFGKKSEKISSMYEQALLFPIAEEVAPEEAAVVSEEVTVPEHKRKKRKSRSELPEGTIVERVEHPASQHLRLTAIAVAKS